MKQPTSLVFVCQNLRDADNPKGSCMARGSKAVLERMKGTRESLGLKHSLRVMGATCLGSCESGVTVLVVDEREGATFYGRMDPARGERRIPEPLAAGADGPERQRHRLPKDNLLDVSAIEHGSESKP